MIRKLTREQFLEAAQSPKRRFATLTVEPSGKAHLGSPVGSPSYWYERHEEVVEADGSYVVERNRATVTMVVDGTPSVLFYLVGTRVDTCTFGFNLTAHQLGKAVVAMKRAKLSKLIARAASAALENLPEQRRATLEPDLRRLAASGRTRRKTGGG